jgi:Fibronectin type III domain
MTNPAPTGAPAAARRRHRRAAPAVRGRRRSAARVVIVIVAVLGLAAGVVIWAPWKSPPLVRPAGLVAGTATTGSVAFRWSRPATGPDPDKYVIVRDGKVAGSVPGTVTSYRDTGLNPGTAYQYRVAAVRGGQRSALSPVLVVSTTTPPVSAARWQGPFTVSIHIIRGASALQGKHASHDGWTESWVATPKCPSGPCGVRLSGHINGHRFTATLARAGAVYTGKTTATVFRCGPHSGSVPVRSVVTIRVTMRRALDVPAWTASSWAGSMVISSPYTSSGTFYCNAFRLTASVSGTT